MENISKLLVTMRVQRALSQATVARKINLSQSQYSKMESGEKSFPLDKFIALAGALGIRPWTLMECLVLAGSKPDEGIKKAVNELNSGAAAATSAAPVKEGPNYRELATYWEEKYFALYREHLGICAQLETAG